MIYKEITECRICQSKNLTQILDLGQQALTGVFPVPGEKIERSPIVVVRCDDCWLVQLRHTADLSKMYGETYGYESSLNASMVSHLEEISKSLTDYIKLKKDDIILDIGSNDATFLRFFDSNKYRLIGIDPSAEKFRRKYGQDIEVVVDFFSKSNFESEFPGEKAKVITSIACFYDLEQPVQFAKETSEILAEDGIWLAEMAYLPAVIRNLAFDGYVQEHLLYYTLKDIKNIMNQVGLKIIDVSFNNVNGGSFRVVAAHKNHPLKEYELLGLLLGQEATFGLGDLKIHRDFENKVKKFKKDFVAILQKLKTEGKMVLGLGASTKFNAILQYCGIDYSLLPVIGEVNSYKYGRITPGTNIPIAAEQDVLKSAPDVLVIGPYHFRDSLIKKYKDYLDGGGKMLFPLPALEMVDKDNV